MSFRLIAKVVYHDKEGQNVPPCSVHIHRHGLGVGLGASKFIASCSPSAPQAKQKSKKSDEIIIALKYRITLQYSL